MENKIIVNQTHTYTLEDKGNELRINGELVAPDCRELRKDVFHILSKDKGYSSEILSIDRKAKKVELLLNGTRYEVAIQDSFDLTIEALGMEFTETENDKVVLAPMPGLVLSVHTEEGAAIEENETLLVLEAMKMENIIKSPMNASIKTVEVTPGSIVEKGQVLLTFA